MNKILGKVVGNTAATPIRIPEVNNVLKAHVSGCPLVLNDVSPIEHDMLVTEDVGATAIVRCGKNMFPRNGQLKFTGSNTFTYKDLNIPTPFTISLTISVESFGSSFKATLVEFTYDDGSTSTLAISSMQENLDLVLGKTIRLSSSPKVSNKMLTQVAFINWCKMTGTVEDVMVEMGKVATEYEPYVEPIRYEHEDNAEIIKIPSLYPTTVLYEAGGVGIVTAEYNRDINKVISNLENAILSIGGNV